MLATVLSQLAKINDLLEHNAATNAFLKNIIKMPIDVEKYM